MPSRDSGPARGSGPDRSSDPARLMDRIYRRQSRVYDLTRRFTLAGRDALLDSIIEETVRGRHAGAILEIGTGTGRNLFRLAERLPVARLVGVDISTVMLERAEERRRAVLRPHARTGLARDSGLARDTEKDSRIVFLQGSAAELERVAGLTERGPFSTIFFSYSLSMIPDWPRALESALDLLLPDGALHVVDFGDLKRWPAVPRSLFDRWLARWHVRRVPELRARLGAIADTRGLSLSVRGIFGGYAMLMRLGPAAAASGEPRPGGR